MLHVESVRGGDVHRIEGSVAAHLLDVGVDGFAVLSAELVEDGGIRVGGGAHFDLVELAHRRQHLARSAAESGDADTERAR